MNKQKIVNKPVGRQKLQSLGMLSSKETFVLINVWVLWLSATELIAIRNEAHFVWLLACLASCSQRYVQSLL